MSPADFAWPKRWIKGRQGQGGEDDEGTVVHTTGKRAGISLRGKETNWIQAVPLFIIRLVDRDRQDRLGAADPARGYLKQGMEP